MEKFYIDRQFGHPIWIEVDKGIVIRCFNEESKYIAKMNEMYVGKSITFLKEDFIDRAMAGTYHHLRAESIVSFRQIAAAAESKVRDMYGKISEVNRTLYHDDPMKLRKEEKLMELRTQKADFEVEQYKAERMVKSETERILTEHNFQS